MALDELRLLAVTHEASRTGAPIVLLRFLQWLRNEHGSHVETIALKGGPLLEEFAAVGPVHHIPAYGTESLPRRVEQGMLRAGLERSSTSVRMARLKLQSRNLRGFDVLYCNSSTSAVALRMLPELPPHVIAHVHELTSAFNHWMDDEDRRWLLAHSSRFVVAADCVGANLVDNHGVDAAHIRRCYEFIDPPSTSRRDVERARAALSLDDDELVVGCMGTADWRKGTDLFLQMAALVRRRAPDLKVRFVWVGFRPEWESIGHDADVRGLGLDDILTFAGEVADPASYLELMDVFCLTSREDPYPLVCLEAGALGVPVVSFDNGGMRELAMASGEEPLLTRIPYLDVEQMADAVIERLRSPALRALEGARLQEWVLDKHLADRGAADIGVVMAELLGASARS